MATPRSQRIGMWVIAVALTVGTVGGFLAMIIQPKNDAKDQAQFEQLSDDYQKELSEYQAKVGKLQDEQGKKLSKKYYQQFSSYQKHVKKFNANAVDELKTKDVVKGKGEKISASSTYLAYYIGWTADGKVFDSSIEGKSLKSPLPVEPGGVITGWAEGVDGMKSGGVRQLTIPSEQAYGEAGSGDIPPDAPLKFIVMVLPDKPAGDDLEEPQPSAELMKYYERLQSRGMM